MTRIRQRLPETMFEEVFRFVIAAAVKRGLLRGKTIGVDATTLEANAAMKALVRRDTGEDWKEYLRRLAQGREGRVGDVRFSSVAVHSDLYNDHWVCCYRWAGFPPAFGREDRLSRELPERMCPWRVRLCNQGKRSMRRVSACLQQPLSGHCLRLGARRICPNQ